MNLSCNDSYGNSGANWCNTGDPTGRYGNISADPLFCDYPNDDLTLDSDSPCAPGHNPICGLIGAQPVGCGISGVDDGLARVPAERIRVIPNPCPPPCRLDFSIPASGAAQIGIFDAQGRRVRWINERSGDARVTWDGLDDRGRSVPPGVYFIRLNPGGVGSRLVLAR